MSRYIHAGDAVAGGCMAGPCLGWSLEGLFFFKINSLLFFYVLEKKKKQSTPLSAPDDPGGNPAHGLRSEKEFKQHGSQRKGLCVETGSLSAVWVPPIAPCCVGELVPGRVCAWRRVAVGP